MFAIPSLKESVERVRQSFRSNLPGSDAYIWPNNINPTAKVFGGLTHEIFGFADYIQRQKFALTADSENLDLHGAELGLSRKPAAPASGGVALSASGALVVTSGAVFRRADGVEYLAVAGASQAIAGTVSFEVIAATDGAAANALANTSLEIVSGVTDAAGDAQAVVDDAGIVLGADIEDDESFRTRILFRKRNPPHGGSAADYVIWAKEVSGVTRVFVERLFAGVGTVRVFPLFDDSFANGIPDVASVARVAEHIQGLCPAGALVTVAAPVALPIDITIKDISPDTPAVRNAVIAELQAGFRRLGRVAGIDTRHGGMDFLAVPTSFSRSWIWQTIANASGEERHILTAPAADVAVATGFIPVPGNITFV